MKISRMVQIKQHPFFSLEFTHLPGVLTNLLILFIFIIMKANYSLAIKAAIRAGKAIMEVYGSDNFGVETKDDQSPLTLADKRAHAIIMEHLS